MSLLHFTDCHAQLLPIYFREPSVNLGVGDVAGKPPHLVGEALLKHFGITPGTRDAHAFTYLDFARRGEDLRQGRRLRAPRHAGQAAEGVAAAARCCSTAATPGRARPPRCGRRARTWSTRSKLLGVDVMTGHWEFTLGAERVKEIVDKDFAGKIDFVAQNVKTADFGDPVFPPYVIRPINGVPVAIVGQAFPYTPIANPRYFVADWTFGIQDENLQKVVDEARGKGAQVVVLLSHNGMDVDLKLASRVRGIDAILGGHTHDGVPQPTIVANARRQDARHQRRQQRQVPRACSTSTSRAARSPTSATSCCRCSPTCCRADPGDGRADRQGARAVRGEARGEARGHRGAALPARQLQRHVRPADPRRR